MNINDTIVLLIKWSFFELKKLPTTFIQSTSRIICQLSYIKFNKFVVCIVNNNALVCLWIKLLWEIAIILNERKEMNLFKQGDSLGETERWIRIILWIVYFLFCFSNNSKGYTWKHISNKKIISYQEIFLTILSTV